MKQMSNLLNKEFKVMIVKTIKKQKQTKKKTLTKRLDE